MYVGRFVVAGPSVAAYRVSSRSFPNREIVAREGADAGAADALTVVPTADAPETDNPYVSYNCLRVVDDAAVVGNGSHVDPIAEKLDLGYPARDALAACLLALDYEKDDYDTPRIAAVLDADGGAVVGIVRRDALLVEAVDEPTLVATYERDVPAPYDLAAGTAAAAAREVYDADFEHAVCAAAVARTPDGGFETAVVDGE